MKMKYGEKGKGFERKEVKFQKAAGWLTDDEYEIWLRRHRAETEDMTVKKIDGIPGIFTDYAVSKEDADRKTAYTVELRSTDSLINSCTCPDFKKNFLGTCKHIEKVLLKESRKNKSKGKSPFVEIFLGNAEFATEVKAQIPENIEAGVVQLISRYFDVNGIGAIAYNNLYIN